MDTFSSNKKKLNRFAYRLIKNKAAAYRLAGVAIELEKGSDFD